MAVTQPQRSVRKKTPRTDAAGRTPLAARSCQPSSSRILTVKLAVPERIQRLALGVVIRTGKAHHRGVHQALADSPRPPPQATAATAPAPAHPPQASAQARSDSQPDYHVEQPCRSANLNKLPDPPRKLIDRPDAPISAKAVYNPPNVVIPRAEENTRGRQAIFTAGTTLHGQLRPAFAVPMLARSASRTAGPP